MTVSQIMEGILALMPDIGLLNLRIERHFYTADARYFVSISPESGFANLFYNRNDILAYYGKGDNFENAFKNLISQIADEPLCKEIYGVNKLSDFIPVKELS